MFDKGYRIEGIILKRKNYSEADKILTIFTKQKGKIICLAKGIRKISSKRAPSLELFNQILAFIVKTKGMDILTEVEAISCFPQIEKRLTKISNVYFIAELVDKLTAENQENILIYNLLLQTLKNIGKIDDFKEEDLVKFQIKLLTFLGFGLPPLINKNELNDFIERIADSKINSFRFLEN